MPTTEPMAEDVQVSEAALEVRARVIGGVCHHWPERECNLDVGALCPPCTRAVNIRTALRAARAEGRRDAEREAEAGRVLRKCVVEFRRREWGYLPLPQQRTTLDDMLTAYDLAVAPLRREAVDGEQPT